MIAHCLFEQSGTFKNEFKKLGVQAFDYDIQDEFGETDFNIDLFNEIEKSWGGQKTIFDTFQKDDIVMAFFPCTRFESRIPLVFRGEQFQQRNYSDIQKLECAMKLHEELHRNYMLISKMVCIAKHKGFKMVIENPYTQPHYLTTYWCIKPSIIDRDRTENGDYYTKPTQYWFINFNPSENFIFEPIDYVEKRTIDKMQGKDRTTQRSMIHPQYANRFIRRYIL